VTIVVHPLDYTSPVLVDSSLSDIVAGKEKRGVPTPGFKLLHDALSVDVRTIVVSDSNRAGVVAGIDTGPTVGDTSKLGTGVVASACSTRGLVSITPRSVVEEAVGCLAMFLGSTAVSGRRAAVVPSADLVSELRSTAFRTGSLTGPDSAYWVSSLAGLEAGKRVAGPQMLWQAKDAGSAFNPMCSDKWYHQRGGNNLRVTHYR
jgi:hypothetical protein